MPLFESTFHFPLKQKKPPPLFGRTLAENAAIISHQFLAYFHKTDVAQLQ
jgi:hypothetical protein